MNAQIRKLVSIAAVGLLAGGSGAAFAEAGFSVYHLAELMHARTAQAAQAGPAGPAHIATIEAARMPDWPAESLYSVYHIAHEHAHTTTVQRGPAGPANLPGGNPMVVSEYMYSIYDWENLR